MNWRLLLSACACGTLKNGLAEIFGIFAGKERIGCADVLPEMGIAAARLGQVPFLIRAEYGRALRGVGWRGIVDLDPINLIALFK